MTRRDEDQTDEDLVERIAAGDHVAFATLDHRHRKRVLHFAMGIVHRPDVADEIANDTLLAVWVGAKKFEGRSKVTTPGSSVSHGARRRRRYGGKGWNAVASRLMRWRSFRIRRRPSRRWHWNARNSGGRFVSSRSSFAQ